MSLISVIMATDRITDYLIPSVKSILDQTYNNIELIIVCNGNDRNSVQDFLKKKFNDKRLIILTTKIRQLSSSLNLALNHANGELIARMDADDISIKQRLEIQLKILKEKKLDLLGSFLELINEDGKNIGFRPYPIDKEIDNNIYFKNPFAHNTILCKKKILIDVRGYLGGFNTEDYDLWLRLKKTKIKWNNCQDFLVKYRIHNASSQRKTLSYSEAAAHVYREFLLNPSIKLFIAFLYNAIKKFILSVR